jgi:cellulose synthase/poly-beta-1,6-N-acetylglucosamine synthase-like glycosyltransferase
VSESVPQVSFIIPLVRINAYVRETIANLQKLNCQNWEAIVITNDPEMSEWPTDPRIRMLSSGPVGPAQKRDLAAEVAQSPILTFVDDDSYPSTTFVDTCLGAFSDQSVAAAGGPALTPSDDSFWQKVSGAVFMSRFTGGNPSRYRPVGEIQEIDDWPSVNLSVRREVFMEVGGFDTHYWPGEDTFFCWKLKESGHRMLYVPALIVWHHRREGYIRHLKQVSAYGLHRGYFARHFPATSFRLKYFLPSLMCLIATLLPILLYLDVFNHQLALVIVGIYTSAIGLGTFEIVRHTSFKVGIMSVPYVIATHVSYGLSFLRGLLKRGELQSKLRR